MELVEGRRTIRTFARKPVPDDIVRKCLLAAHWAPSACNRQLWEFVVIRDSAIVSALESITHQSNPGAVYIAVFYDLTKELPGSRFGDIQSAAMAEQNLILAAHSLGYGTKVQAGLNDTRAISELLKAPEGVEIISLIALGYPEDTPESPRRRPIGEIVHLDTFSISRPRYPSHLDARLWSEEEVVTLQSGVVRHGGHIGFYRSSVEPDVLRDIMAPLRLTPGCRILAMYPYSSRYINQLVSRYPDCTFETVCQSDDNAVYLKSGVDAAIRVHTGGFTETSMDGGVYDTVLLLDSCIHIPDLGSTLREANRLLKPGGDIFVSMPSLWSPMVFGKWMHRRSRLLNQTPYWCIGPIHPLSALGLSRQLSAAGFSVEERHHVSVQRDLRRENKSPAKRFIIWLMKRLGNVFCDVVICKARKEK